MRIRMNTLSAGPNGVLLAGGEYEVPEAEARQLVAGGYAAPVNSPPSTAAQGTGPERTTRPPGETAAPSKPTEDRRGRGKGKKS